MTRSFAFAIMMMVTQTAAAQQIASRDACGAAGLQELIGQSSEVISYISRHLPVRRIGSGGPLRVNPVFVLNRITFELDANGIIVAVWCG